MFPLRDENQAEGWPVVTIALIAANALVWILLQCLGIDAMLSRSVCSLGLIPGELLGSVPPGTQVSLGEGASCVIGQPNWLAPLTPLIMHARGGDLFAH